MQWVTRLVSRASGSGAEPAETFSEQALAEIAKIKQLWAGYTSLRDEQEKANRVVRVVPHFIKAYAGVEGTRISDSYALCRLLIREIKSSWKPGQPNDMNAKLVLKFLIKPEKTQLLKALEIVSLGAFNVEVISAAGIPSTFLQTLHLLYFHPNEPSMTPTILSVEEQLTRILIQLLNYRFALTDLVAANALATLHAMLLSECPPHNCHLRDRMQLVVSATVKYMSDPELLAHIQKRTVIQTFVQQLRASRDSVSADSLVGVLNVIVSLLKESLLSSKAVIATFAEAGGYEVLLECVLALETRSSVETMERLVQGITAFCYVGVGVPKPTGNSSSPYMERKASGQPNDDQYLVRNVQAFQLLSNFFLRSSQSPIQLKILEAILNVFASNHANFPSLQHLHTLAHFIENLARFSIEVQDAVLRMLVFVATVGGCVPFQELVGLSCLLDLQPHMNIFVLLFQTVTKLVNYDAKYRKILQETGLLDVLINHTKKYACNLPQGPEQEACYTVVMDTLAVLLERMPENAGIFRTSGALAVLTVLMKREQTRAGALLALNQLIQQHETQEMMNSDIMMLLDILKGQNKSEFDLKKDILGVITRIFQGQRRSKDCFRECGGFVCLVSLIMGLEATVQDGPPITASPADGANRSRATTLGLSEAKASLLEGVFKTMTAAIASHPPNREFFQEQISRTLGGALQLTGVLQVQPVALRVCICLIDLAVENLQPLPAVASSAVQNPEAIRVTLEILPSCPSPVQLQVFARINAMAAALKHNLDAFAKAGVLQFVLTNFGPQLSNSSHFLHAPLAQFTELVGAHALSVVEMHHCLRLIQGAVAGPSPLVGVLQNTVKFGRSPSFFEFDLRRYPSAYIRTGSLGDRAWPPANGYSIMFWLSVEAFGEDGVVDLFQFTTGQSSSADDKLIYAQLKDGVMHVQVGKQTAEFSQFKFPKGRWLHIAIVHARNRLYASELKLYVDGTSRQAVKIPYPTMATGSVSGIIGTSEQAAKHTSQMWRLCGLFFTEEVLSSAQFKIVHRLGPGYGHTFQGALSVHQTYEMYDPDSLLAVLEQQKVAFPLNPLALFSAGTSPLGELDLATGQFTLAEDRLLLALSPRNVESRPPNLPTIKLSMICFLMSLCCFRITTSLSNLAQPDQPPSCVVFNMAVVAPAPSTPLVLSGGVEAFVPCDFGAGVRRIGGLPVVIMLVDRSSSAEALTLALGLLVNVVRFNSTNTRQMEEMHGYEILGYLLKRKAALLEVETANALFEFVGMNTPPRSEALSNPLAFRFLFLDFDLWKTRPAEVQRHIFSRFNELLLDNKLRTFNSWRLRKLHALHHLLAVLRDESVPENVLPNVIDSIAHLLLASPALEEDFVVLSNFLQTLVAMRIGEAAKGRRPSAAVSGQKIRLLHIRTLLLDMLLQLLLKPESSRLVQRLFKTQWVFPFLSPTLGSATVVLALKILVTLLTTSSAFFQKFRNGSGFDLLRELLAAHHSTVELYFVLLCLLFGKSVTAVSWDSVATLDVLDMSIVFKADEGLYQAYCPEVLPLLFSMVRRAYSYTIQDTPAAFSHSAEDVQEHSARKLSSAPPPMTHADDKETSQPFDLHRRIVRLFGYLLASESATAIHVALRRREVLEAMVEPLFITPAAGNHEPYRAFVEDVHDVLSNVVWTSLHSERKIASALELIVEACPPLISDTQFVSFQNRILTDVLALLRKNISRKVLVESTKLATNVSRLCGVYVEKLYQGFFFAGAKALFDFLLELLEQLSEGVELRRLPEAFPLLCAPLNRVIVYLLATPMVVARPEDNQRRAEETGHYRGVMQRMQHFSRIIFHPGNASNEFIQCLGYRLGQFLVADSRELREMAMDLWHKIMLARPKLVEEMLICRTAKGEQYDIKTRGFDLLLQRDFAGFSNWIGDHHLAVKAVMGDAMMRAWTAAQQAERTRKVDQLRLLKQKREQRQLITQKTVSQQFLLRKQLREHISSQLHAMKEAELARWRKQRIEDIDRDRFAYVQWSRMRQELIAERGVWAENIVEQGSNSPLMGELQRPVSPQLGSSLATTLLARKPAATKAMWALDETEGPLRIRIRLENLDAQHYPYVPPSFARREPTLDASTVTPVSSSSGSGSSVLSPARTHLVGSGSHSTASVHAAQLAAIQAESLAATQASPPVLPLSGELPDESRSPPSVSVNELLDRLIGDENAVLPMPPQSPSSEPEMHLPDSASVDEERESPEKSSSGAAEEEAFDEEQEELEDEKIHRLLEEGDAIEAAFNCAAVSAMDKVDGVFLLCTSHLYVIEGYCVNSLAEIVPLETKKEEKEAAESGANSKSERKKQWAYDVVRAMERRRYLLQHVAVELFSADGRNQLIVFSPTDREEALRQLAPKLAASAQARVVEASGLDSALPQFSDSDWGVNRLVTGVTAALMGGRDTTEVTEKWVAGKVSNFQYLMYLNTLAGRSYNDLTQYPVFPWVIADYESPELDLTNPVTFRDLSKPMGALTARRAAAFKARFDAWEEADNDGVPKWHYGTHYSSAATVLYFLIRLEPFTSHFLKLHSGRFDVPDRIFHSIADTWISASGVSYNLADVKELTPEFYFLPDFLENKNSLVLGERSSGERVGDVILPPWAHGDVREFVRKMQLALESDYVSENLHQWIDLIFGYKQQGKAAEESLNVFYHLTYEGAVDVNAITDNTERASVLAQINNFGQTPSQLFRKPHPKRAASSMALATLSMFSGSGRPTPTHVRDLPEAVGAMHVSRAQTDKVIALGRKRLLLPPACNKYAAWGYHDGSLRILNADATASLAEVVESPHEGQITCAATSEDGRLLVLGGTDTVVSVHSVRTTPGTETRRIRFVKNLCGHLGPITCLALSRAFSVLVSGSEDRTCILWDINRLRYVRQLPRFIGHEAAISALAINDVTGEIVSCAGTSVNVWTINGDLLISKRTSQAVTETITSCTVSRGAQWIDSHNVVITGHRNGGIRVWMNAYVSQGPGAPQKRDLSLLWSAPVVHSAPIAVLLVAPDLKRLFSGDEAGRIFVWTVKASDDPRAEEEARRKGVAAILKWTG